MEHVTVGQVAELLKEEGFPEDVVQRFAESAVDGKALMMLETDEDMKELGLNKLGDRLKLKKLISKSRGGANKELDNDKKESVRKILIKMYILSHVACFCFWLDYSTVEPRLSEPFGHRCPDTGAN